jgi:hypothetical protein
MATSYEIAKLLRAPLEDVLLKLYSVGTLNWVYEAGLRALAETHPASLPQPERPRTGKADKTPRKPYLIALFLAVLRDRAMARRFFDALPEASRDVLTTVTWDRRANLAVVEKMWDVTVATPNPDEHRAYYDPFLLSPEHGLLAVVAKTDRHWGYFSLPKKAEKKDYCLVLPDAMRKAFKTFVPPPVEYELLPLDKLPSGPGRHYSCAEKAVADMRLVAEYIAQGHLKYTKSERVAMPSLKALRQMTGGPEFFEDSGDSDLALLRTRLLAGGVAFAGEKERGAFLERPDNADAVVKLFEKASANAAFLHEELLAHLAHSSNRWCQYDSGAIADLPAFFGKLPEGRWISWDNIRAYHALRERQPTLFVRAAGLQSRATVKGDTWSVYTGLDESNEFDLVGEPLLKGYAFLLAAFGLAEIAYIPPKHPIYRRPKAEYLTPFDGLGYVRLTPLGEYAFGLRKKYEVAGAAPTRAAVVLDEVRLLATCPNADPLTELALGQFMEKLGAGRYRMTPKSLLGGCRSREDIEERIRLFRRAIAAKPPRVWEEFFGRTLARTAPLGLEPGYVVLKLGADEEIRRLFASDRALREMVLKVEGLRIAVRRDDLKALARRLEQFGYLSPLPPVTP